MQEIKRIKNPKKQRKRLFNAPAHIRHKLMAAPLSNELAASRGAKTLPVRKGDTVRVERGDNKGFEGKVSRVDLKHFRIYMEGLTREKVDGTNIFVAVHPSKVQIRNLNLDDKWRKDILGRKKEIQKPEKAEKPVAKPKKVEKVVEKPKAEEEKTVEAPMVGEVPAEEVPEEKAEVVPEKALATKKPAAKKEVPEKKAPAKEKAPVKEEKASAKKTAAKKTAATKEKAPEKETVAKKAAAKPRAKSKTSEENVGGQ